MKFDEFNISKQLKENIKKTGYIEPTPIQEKAIPLVLNGQDVLGVAQTGTGKTAAFMLPIIQKLLKGPKRRVRALVLAPTRELAEQIHEATKEMSRNTGIRSLSIYGGVSKKPRIAAIKRGVEIVIACPGRLLDHLSCKEIDLSHLDILVLDEADMMCDMGFLPDIRRILKFIPNERQTLFFSATMPKDIRKLADSMLKNPKKIQIGNIAPAETVSHAMFPVPHSKKKALLFELLKNTETGRVLIFTRTKHRAQNLAQQLGNKKYNVSALQGNMSQNRRQQAINGFKNGKYDMLVATDIAARGIHVSEVTHVINYDMPDTADAYTHRTGRTGRAFHTGDAFTLFTKEDEGTLKCIEKNLGRPIEKKNLPGFDYGVVSNSRATGKKSSSKNRNSRKSRRAYAR